MFVTPSTVKSTSVRNIQLNPVTNQVIAQFKNNSKTYLYENVSEDAILDVIFGEITSLGKFINAYCRGNESVTVGWVNSPFTLISPLFFAMIAMPTPTVLNISTMTGSERDAFADWYDSKSEEYQLLIDEISDRTSYIIDEDEYDAFIEELANYGINDSSQFEDAFEREVEGYSERVFADFAEELIESCGYTIEPEFIANCIDWERVWYSELRHDYQTIEFKGNTYFFRNIWESFSINI